MTDLQLWAMGIAYLAVHLLLYLAVLRRIPSFVSERGVFLYHVASAVLYSGIAGGCWLLAPSAGMTFAVMVGLVMLHGLYSLSFLEVWSLTEGSYSLQIVRAVVEADAHRAPLNMTHLESIGAQKSVGRTDAGVRLGLITVAGGVASLTARGRVVARALGMLRSLVDTQSQA